MKYENYIPHIHTEQRPEGYPVRKMPGRRGWIPVGLGQLDPIDLTTLPKRIESGSAMRPGETPEQYRERRLRELGEPLTVTVRKGTGTAAADSFSSVPVTPLLLAAAVVAFIWSQR